MHGSATEAARAAGEAKQLEQRAADEVRKLWPSLAGAQPVKDPGAALALLAGQLQELLDQVGEKVNALGHLAAGESLSQMRGEVVLLERVARLLSTVLDSLARLGLAERQIEFEEGQAQAIVSAFLAALVLAPGLPVETKDAMVGTFLEGLGWSPEALALGTGGAA